MYFNLVNDVAELTKGFSRAEYQAQHILTSTCVFLV